MNVDWIREAVKRGQGVLNPAGALMVDTGTHTGRAAKHRYIVNSPAVSSLVDWGPINQAIQPEVSESFFADLTQALSQGDSFSMKAFVGPVPIQVTSASPWHIAFAQNMFRARPIADLATRFEQEKSIEVLHFPYFSAKHWNRDYPSDTMIVVDLEQRRVGIVGTAYAGEIKKSAFTLCNYLFPEFGIFPMHASANCLTDGSKSSVLFGLSGTGKTTLSASPDRALIGDDEIIWTESGISNLEGGCYAKLANLSAENEPEIFRAIHRNGAILENVFYDENSLEVDFSNISKTENTRGSYDLGALRNVYAQDREATAPETIIFLTADAFGALPAVARLDFWQAQFHFMSGYTAKVAGTEMGVVTPTAAFSACFGAPFMPRTPATYAQMLAQRAAKAKTSVWLLNTGWVGGYGKGERFPIPVSRKILSAIQDGSLDAVEMVRHPVFGFSVPQVCPGVEKRWLEIPDGPHVQTLAQRFLKNFEKYEGKVDPQVLLRGGPFPATLQDYISEIFQ